jgi:hypothetical protein
MAASRSTSSFDREAGAALPGSGGFATPAVVTSTLFHWSFARSPLGAPRRISRVAPGHEPSSPGYRPIDIMATRTGPHAVSRMFPTA